VSSSHAISRYWSRDGLDIAILDALVASGKDLERLTVDDLAPLDQFHGGGKGATVRLARLAKLATGLRVLDVGGGLGGPARTLAVEFGCQVTSIDLTEAYVRVAAMLTDRLRLADRVRHRVADALDLSFEDASFDVIWTQNSGMNIADKVRLYHGFHRVLRPGGRLAIQEPMAGPVQPVVFPVMWARDAASSFLDTPARLRAIIEGTGFRTTAWDDVTAETAGAATADAIPAASVQRIVMGAALGDIVRAGNANREQHRIVLVQAVFERL
jgi:MPBQ/MSBQ methyltransferase